jgi:hypothetical protein
VGFEQVQEDEWAICTSGQPSLYQTIAFPNRSRHDSEYISLAALPKRQRSRWVNRWTTFLRSIVVQIGDKRLIVKSPLHLARLNLLLELFPDARFVHIVRAPCDVYSSTLRLWQRLAEDEGLQAPKSRDLRSFVLENYVQMYRSFDRHSVLVEPRRLCTVRYEDLIADPMGEMLRIYRHLDLGDFEVARPVLESIAAQMSRFQSNRHSLSPEDAAMVSRHWGETAARYGGYNPPQSVPAA